MLYKTLPRSNRSTRLFLTVVLCSVLLAMLFFPLAYSASASPVLVFVVNSTADQDDATPGDGLCQTADGDCTLRAAVQEGNAQGVPNTITFDPPISGMPIVLTQGQIVITNDLTITGLGVDNTIIDGSANSRIFRVQADVETLIEGVTLTNGTDTNGAGIFNEGALTITNSLISENVATGTGAAEGGGGIFNSGMLSLVSTNMMSNTAEMGSGSGGGIFNAMGAMLEVTGGTFAGNNAARAGGGIETTPDATVTLTLVDFVSNRTGPTPGNGGAVHMTGNGTVTVTGGNVTGNTASAEGGGLWNGSGTMVVDGTIISDNEAEGNETAQGGGGLFNNGGTLIVRNATITGNRATGTAAGMGTEAGSGGGILNDGGTLEVSDTLIADNSAPRAGGGIEDNARTTTTTTTLTNVVLRANETGPSPGNGGGYHISGPGNAQVLGGDVTGNTASAEGGGLWNGTGTMEVDGTTISGNVAEGNETAQGGGGLFNNGGTLIVRNATITGNLATGTASGMGTEAGSGGGILNDGGTLEVSDTLIANNSAPRAGGGIEDNARTSVTTTTLTNVVLRENETGPSPGNGGGYHISGPGMGTVVGSTVEFNTAVEGGGLWNSSSGTMLVDRTTVNNNRSVGMGEGEDGGGGVFNDGGTLTVVNSTISSNSAAASGGGLSNVGDNSNVQVINTTIFENSAAGAMAAGGIDNMGGTLTIRNSIIAHQEAEGSDCRGLIDADNPNLDSDGSCGASITADPQLGPLQDNGGPTATHAPSSGSPAVDAGDDIVCNMPPVNGIDQRGVPRPAGLSCDLGAVEVEAVTAVTVDQLAAESQARWPFALLAGAAGLAALAAGWRRMR
jgi:fibronectin-binding autotransporter adhesin